MKVPQISPKGHTWVTLSRTSGRAAQLALPAFPRPLGSQRHDGKACPLWQGKGEAFTAERARQSRVGHDLARAGTGRTVILRTVAVARLWTFPYREIKAVMIGFHDYILRQGSGRPEPHESWAAERFTTWTVWFTAVIFVVAGIYYYAKWQEADSAGSMLLAGALFATVAYFRRTALNRKREALNKAVVRYEQMLGEPFL